MRNLFSGRKKFVTIPLTALLFVVFAFASPSPKQQEIATPSENTLPSEEPVFILPASDQQSGVSIIPASSKTPTPTITSKQNITPKSSGGAYACNCSKTCEQISSCSEAQYQLNVCGCSRRDADHDGIACDAAPLNCQ